MPITSPCTLKDIVILCPVIVKPVLITAFHHTGKRWYQIPWFAPEGAVHHMILGCRPIYRFTGTESIGVVGIRNRITIMRYRRQSSPVLPGKR